MQQMRNEKNNTDTSTLFATSAPVGSGGPLKMCSAHVSMSRRLPENPLVNHATLARSWAVLVTSTGACRIHGTRATSFKNANKICNAMGCRSARPRSRASEARAINEASTSSSGCFPPARRQCNNSSSLSVRPFLGSRSYSSKNARWPRAAVEGVVGVRVRTIYCYLVVERASPQCGDVGLYIVALMREQNCQAWWQRVLIFALVLV